MTLVKAMNIVDGIVDSTDEEASEAWTYLFDHGHLYTLPGRYGRTFQALVNQGFIF